MNNNKIFAKPPDKADLILYIKVNMDAVLQNIIKAIKEMDVSSPKDKPAIVCLCGSTRFSDAFRKANLEETLAGKIVLTIGCDFKSDDALNLTIEDKNRLDELHFRKIDLSGEILVLNVDGYIGESTRNEINYAISKGKKIRYREATDGQSCS